MLAECTEFTPIEFASRVARGGRAGLAVGGAPEAVVVAVVDMDVALRTWR